MGREQVVLAHHPEHPLAGVHGCHDRPEAEPRPCGVHSPSMHPGRNQQSLVVEGWSPALCWWALSGGLLPGFHGVERGTGKTPGRIPHGGRRPNPCRERWRHSSPRPPPPQSAGRRGLGLQQFHLHDHGSQYPLGDVQFTNRIKRSLSEASSRRSPSHATARAGTVSTTNGRDERFHRLATQKPQGRPHRLARIYRNIAEPRRPRVPTVQCPVDRGEERLSPAQARQAWHTAMSLRPGMRQTCVQGTGCEPSGAKGCLVSPAGPSTQCSEFALATSKLGSGPSLFMSPKSLTNGNLLTTE